MPHCGPVADITRFACRVERPQALETSAFELVERVGTQMTERSAINGGSEPPQEDPPLFVAIVLCGKDTVATTVADIVAGRDAPILRDGEIDCGIRVAADIPYGHKFAVCAMRAGSEVIKYGEVIGRARSDIDVGEHVHVHNVESQRGRGDLAGGGGVNG